ncbi:MAG: purine-nucleoside phosphorylase [Chloroflexi bacterium]|nr:purine-nucleoside phosphorylase [Chloroflexota bacterium]
MGSAPGAEKPFLQRAEEAAAAIAQRCALRPRLALVLGSGWGDLTDALEGASTIPYGEIPHFPRSTVSWHAGQLWLGHLEGMPTVVMQGRFHPYEGLAAGTVAFPVACLHALGAQELAVTNASGAINPSYQAGDLVLICDHINFLGENPLTGLAGGDGLTRFPDMTYAYDANLRALARRAAQEVGVPLHEGVYVAFRGPSFETPAEIRMARGWGADMVGMSSVPEVIMGRALGMRVLGISCVANMAAGILPQPLTLQEVVEVSQGAVPRMVRLLRAIARALAAIG